MPRQSNGSYVAPANTSAVSGATISSTAYNSLESDLGTEITNSLDRQGRSAMSAALPMGGNKITGMADPVALTDAATRNYALQAAQQQVAQSYANTGTSDALTCACTPTVTALTNGMTFFIRAATANLTVGPTFAPDAIGALQIVKGAGANLAAGDIAGAGMWVSLTYDSTLNKWVMSNPATGIIAPPASLGFFKNLSIKVASNTTVTVSSDSIITSNGSTFQATALSGTINLGTNSVANALDVGTITAATWYYIWAIATPAGVTAALASTSSTSPTLPSGYTYKARIGSVRTAPALAQLIGSWQLGRRAQYVVGLAQCAAMPAIASSIANTSSWVGYSIAGFVPTTASEIFLQGVNNTLSASLALAPNGSYGGPNSTSNPPPMLGGGGSNYVGISGSLLLESSSIYAWGAGSGLYWVYCLGWTDNL